MPMRTRQHVGSLLLLLPLCAALLLAGCAGSSTGIRRTSSPVAATPSTTSSAASPSPSPFSSPTGPIPTNISSLGWVTVSALVYPEAFAATPARLYSCTGATNAGKTNPTITFSTSTDGGTSWQTGDTPVFAGTCQTLAVSPVAAQDVALYAGTCRGDCGQSTQTLYVTTDSGKHWALVSSSQDLSAGSIFGWVGATLFANAAPAGTPPAPQQFLARSINGGSFTWTTLPAAPRRILASGGTLYAVTGSQVNCAAEGYCSDLWTSGDLGATWSHLTPAYQGNNLVVEAVAPSAGRLFAYDARAFAGPNNYPMYRSADGGHTWLPLPQLADLEANTDAIVTPDGTMFVVFLASDAGNSQRDGIYKLAPGASAWKLVSPVVPVQVNLVAVQPDTSGHPVLLWGLAQIGDERYSLFSHPA